jgi:nucleoside-diphosphate-sugar epimerase
VPGPLDYVIHGASAARPAQHSTDPVGTLKANVAGSLHLLDLCVAKRSTGFALMSSAEVYGTQALRSAATPIDENSYGTVDPLHPRSCYSEGKRAAETAAAAYQAQYGLTTRCVRFGHVYGPGMRLDDGRVQADFAADVMAGTNIVLNSDGSSVRTYTYVADAIAGMYYTLLRGSETAYNVADPRGQISIRDLALLFTEARPAKQSRLTYAAAVDARLYSPIRGLALDSTRLQALGWRPLVDLPTGIDRWLTELEGQPDAQSHSS